MLLGVATKWFRRFIDVLQLIKGRSDATFKVSQPSVLDPRQANEEEADFTSQYQKENLQSNGGVNSLHLNAIHQQHVRLNLNHKKRVTMRKLVEELHAGAPNVSTCYFHNFI